MAKKAEKSPRTKRYRKNTLEDKLWKTFRILKRFTIEDVHVVLGEAVKKEEIEDYFNILHKIDYLHKSGKHLYLLKKNTGIYAPHKHKGIKVFLNLEQEKLPQSAKLKTPQVSGRCY